MRAEIRNLLLFSGALSPAQQLAAYVATLSPAQWLDETTPLWQVSDGTVPATANADPIGRWDDRSGNAKHEAQAVAAQRPTLTAGAINGLRAVTGDNTTFSQQLTVALDGTAWTGITVVIVSAPLATEGTRGIWSFADTAASGTPLVLFQRNNADVRFYVDNGYRFTFAQANNVPKIYIITCDGTTWNCWFAGVKQAPYTGGLTNLASAQNVYLHTGFSAVSKSLIAETILLNYALTDAQVNILYLLLAAKWNL
jgi:hypothetical protein